MSQRTALQCLQGEMELVAQLEEGKLAGEYNVADREQGEWKAVRV